MPHFVSRLAPIDGQEVGVVRVYEGALKPYVTGGTVYVREPGGGRPARDRAEVMALARESVVAESAADARLNDRGALPMMSTELDLPPVPPLRPTGDLVVVVRATPIQLPSHFAEGVLTEVAAQRAVSIAANLANSVLAPRSRHRPFSRSSGEGYVATCDTQGHGGGTPVVTTMGADAGGLVALSPSTPQAEPPHSPGRQGGVVQADGQ